MTLPVSFDEEKINLIKTTICKGSTNEELELFVYTCKRTGLDPFMRQVYAVKRWNSKTGKEEMSIQTGIDGFRLIAERTGKYAPGKETSYQYNGEKIISATAYVKKMTPDGTWHEVSGTAFYEEYVQTTKDGTPTSFWKRMPHVMLSKCAESIALRRAFPAELSGLYTKEEMSQAMVEIPEVKVEAPHFFLKDLEEEFEKQGLDTNLLEDYVDHLADKSKKDKERIIEAALTDEALTSRFVTSYKKWKKENESDVIEEYSVN